MKAGQRHYFIADPALARRERTWDVTLLGQPFRFTTCEGLFSYEKPDAASVLLLEIMRDTLAPLEGELLDLGCGYGLLGVVLLKTHTEHSNLSNPSNKNKSSLTPSNANKTILTLSDINEIACAYAARNLTANGIEGEVIQSDGFAHIHGRFRHITLNPPIHAGKDVTYRLYAECAVHLYPGGSLYLVIQKKHGAESTLGYLVGLFHQINILYKRKGYIVAQCTVKE